MSTVTADHLLTQLSRTAIVFILKFSTIATLLTVLSCFDSPSIARQLLPAIQAEIETLDPNYAIEEIAIAHEGADRVVRVRVRQARCIEIDSEIFCGDPRGRAEATVPVGNTTLVSVLLAATVFAWPASQWRTYLIRALLLVPAALLVLSVDLPLMLWGAVWNLHHATLAPDRISPLLIWVDFLQGGGRLALSIVMGAIVVSASHWPIDRTTTTITSVAQPTG